MREREREKERERERKREEVEKRSTTKTKKEKNRWAIIIVTFSPACCYFSRRSSPFLTQEAHDTSPL